MFHGSRSANPISPVTTGGQGLPSRLRWHHDRCTSDSRRLAGTPKSAESGQLQTLAPQQANAGDPFIITRTCRPAYRAYWQLNANQLSSDNDAKSLDSGT